MKQKLALSAAVLVGIAPFANAQVYTDPVGFVKKTLTSGANFIAAPMRRTTDFQGEVLSVGSNVITVKGTPAWTTSPVQFAPKDGFTQYVAVVVKDANAGAVDVQGDWFEITSNTANSLTVVSSASHPFTVEANDQIEIHHLTTIKDLFVNPTTSAVLINKDANGNPSASEEDLIRFVNGTSFGDTVFYHDSNGSVAPTGFYVTDQGPYDGSTITVKPDQPLMFFRKTGAASLDINNVGSVHTKRLTHYLQPGANAIATGFPVGAPIGTSGLTPPSSGWVSDLDGDPNPAQDDLIRVANGTSFTDTLFYHNSNGAVAPTGWYVTDTLNNNYPLDGAVGYFVFLKPSSGSLIWRESVPFTLN